MNLLDYNKSTLKLLFEHGKLYEAVVVIKWPRKNRFNTSVMGVRFGKNHEMYLNPYPDTDTFELLMNPEVSKLTINFTDDIKLFAKAALTGLHAGSEVEEVDRSQLEVHETFAYLKYVQIGILGNVEKRDQDMVVVGDSFMHYNLDQCVTRFHARFLITPEKMYLSSIPAQPVNRGDNLALEAIVYASKLPAFQKQEKSQDEIQKLLEKVRLLQFDIRRFSASHRALVVCDMIDDFIKRSLINSQ